MEFTREQFKKLGGKFHIDDFPLDSDNQDIMFEIFNKLPQTIQGKGLTWSLTDSVFRGECFKYLVNKVYGISIEEFYRSFDFDADLPDYRTILNKL